MKSSAKKGGNSPQRKAIMLLYFLLLLLLWTSQSCAFVELVKVPSLNNKSIAEVDNLLEDSSLIANKSYCFSDSIPKYFVIPDSQDPSSGTMWYRTSQVKVKISQGKFPNLVGMNQADAEQIIINLNLTPKVINERNETVPQGFVFDQEPRTASCRLPDTVKIFINAPLSVHDITFSGSETITKEDNTIYKITVPESFLVKGIVSSRLKKNEHLWIAVKPVLSNNWWPQVSPGEITPYNNGVFQGNAYLGGNGSDLYEIGILILNNETNEKFLEWESSSNEAANWGPITDSNNGLNVTDATINAQKLASVEVQLRKVSSYIDIPKTKPAEPQDKYQEYEEYYQKIYSKKS